MEFDADDEELFGLGVHGFILPDDFVLVPIVLAALCGIVWASMQCLEEEL